MDVLNIPDWAKKLGTIGLILFVIVVVIGIFVEAILQQEAQSLWIDHIKPFLTSSIKINFVLPTWLLIIIIMAIVALTALYFIWLKRPPHLQNGKINSSSLPLPKRFDGIISQSHVFRAVKETRANRLSEKDLAKIIEQAVNHGAIKAEAGAEILKEFDFVLLLNIDKSYTAQKNWRKRGKS